jgi:hypothetical protein
VAVLVVPDNLECYGYLVLVAVLVVLVVMVAEMIEH